MDVTKYIKMIDNDISEYVNVYTDVKADIELIIPSDNIQILKKLSATTLLVSINEDDAHFYGYLSFNIDSQYLILSVDRFILIQLID